MTQFDLLLYWMGIAVMTIPCALVLVLGCTALLNINLSEVVISRLTQTAVLLSLAPAVAILFLMIATGSRYIAIEVGDWVSIPDVHFHFHWKFTFDRLSIPFVILALMLCGVVGAFTRRYLHRDEGYHRFFLLYSLFLSGMVMSALAGTIETLFFGWELVGLSSALLVAYFHEREHPVRNGQRVWSVYRLADASFLLGALLLHHMTGEGDFGSFIRQGTWPDGNTPLSQGQALQVGLLLLLAAAGKSALFPFSGWLPRAMEGPTPSSAVFYGSLSVHLGAYLLLRVNPILEASWLLKIIVVALGIMSALFGSIMSRVQSDVKSSLAYASLTQVGIIVAEIGCGFYYLALIHIMGHACLRTLQLLRAPTLLQDYHAMENAIGTRLPDAKYRVAGLMPNRVSRWWYRFGYERGFMDLLLDSWFVEPFVAIFLWCDGQERRWTDWLSHEPSANCESEAIHPVKRERVA